MKNLGTNTVVALDIGTTKISVLVAEILVDNSLNIIGIGATPSFGVSRGVVVDIAQAVYSIKIAIKEAELMSGIKIENLAVGISGAHITSINSHGMIPIKQGRVKPQDILSVLQAARTIVIPDGQQILHVLPQYYIIDAQQKVLDPTGMFGVRLEVNAHIILGSISAVQNLINCCQIAGVSVTDIILEPLASAHSVLSTDEQELGVGILDIGGGTSDFAIYQAGTIRYTHIFPVAGNHVTHDIALCLRTTLKDAERIKKEFGSSNYKTVDINQDFEVEMVHGNQLKLVKQKDLVDIIQPRIEELFAMVLSQISHQQIKQLMPSGLVLTGGGAMLKSIEQTASEILNVTVRVGRPNVPALYSHSIGSPIYATAYGLLLYLLKNKAAVHINQLSGPLLNRILWKMKTWVSDFF